MVRRMLIYFFLISFLFVGCCNNLDVGLRFNVADLPDIEDFSSSSYEGFENHFPPVDYASYKLNGIETLISPDSPRLIRLLNFLAFSNENCLSTWEQGYIMEDRITQYLAAHEPMLEVIFLNEQDFKGNGNEYTTKIVICGDSYLKFINKNTETGETAEVYAERWWPYGELIMEMITRGEVSSDMISYNGWGTNYWINLLEYAGFN